MRDTKLGALLVLAVFLAGCEPAISLQPFYTEEDPAFDPDLVGIWASPEGGSQPCKMEALGSGAYGLRCKTQDQPSEPRPSAESPPSAPGTEPLNGSLEEQKFGDQKFELRLVRVGNLQFLDFFPESPNVAVDFYGFHLVPGHSLAQFRIAGDELELRFLDNKWVKRMLEQKQIQIDHENAAGTVVLTASSEDLQRFVAHHAEDKDAFACKIKLKRQK